MAKAPPDAVIEWRCLECGRLVGYVHTVNGELTFVTLYRAPADRFNRYPAHMQRESHPVGSRPTSETDLVLRFVYCQQLHQTAVPGAGFIPRPPRRRTVITVPSPPPVSEEEAALRRMTGEIV